ncbi:hypothetical protein [Nevskia sp.]|uniref:hypothetical protein n=1 Tax=Nevskia sp. TaxID=1929292 RepID=UPI0025EB3DBC|nr:hypothetical protein [Nevskia sp.]
MRNVADHALWVNTEVSFQDRRATLLEKQGDPSKALKYRQLADNLKSLLSDFADASTALANANAASAASPSSNASPLSSTLPDNESAKAILSSPLIITPAHLKGLPKELIAQLSISETDRFESNVSQLVSSAVGQTMLLDNILIGLYHINGEQHPRSQLANKLYRMCKKGLLFSVPAKKGLYTTVKPDSTSDEPDLMPEEGEAQ